MTMAVVVSSSSIPNYSYTHDVFISFRGEDTRNNFTSYLYDALCEKQIKTYIDEESLKKGERISELLTAIEESRLSLIVFSKDYAASRWCLDELVKILECKKRGQIVIPIFYRVDPTNIRHQKESYLDAFVQHRKRYHKNKVGEWRKALKEAADLSGFHLQQDHHSEAKFVKNIVQDVLERLYNFPSRNVADDFQGLVGIRKRLKKIESLLCVGSQDVRIVGIWGMGGIGKTTLAQALYNRFSSECESCFFTNVKEDVCKYGLDSLMEKMFCKLLKCGSVHMDSSFKDDQLCRRKVLVVLDNVDKFKQLECLVGENDVPLDVFQREKGRFGVGSRIIITSRDKKLLQRKAYDKIYEVDALDSNEAHSLLYLKAFKRDSLVTDCTGLVERVLDYAKGNPLALAVLGSYLHSRTKDEWESALSELKRAPNESIHEVLRVSYDALDPLKKSIFLDISCFFKGEARDFVEGILGSESHIGINVLIEKSLVTIKDGRLQVHDLIQEMGWEIIRQESRNEDGERSWLRNPKEVFQVLENNKGTKSIEGIFLDMSKIDEDLCLEPTVFDAMSNLRLLKIYNPKFKVYLHQGLRYLPNSLRYLSWSKCPLKTLPTKFRPESLVELEMPFSQLTQLWDGVQHLRNLKCIDFSHSDQLVKIPDLFHASRLVSVDLAGCKSLVEIPPLNFQNFDESVCAYLDLMDCTKLKILPEISGNVNKIRLCGTRIKELPSSIRFLENLIDLDVSLCELEKLPELPRNIEILDLEGTLIREIPVALIDCLHCVREIHMQDCKRLKSLPSNIWLKSLTKLHLSGCSNLKHLPQILEPMENLTLLELSETGIREFPSSIENILRLRRLKMHGCRNLKTIPSKLSCLDLHALEELDLRDCHIFEVPCWIGDLSSLTRINLKGNMFTSIPSSIKKLSKLDYLDISYCQDLLSLPELPLSVMKLWAIGCTSLETVLTSSLLSILTLKNSLVYFWYTGIEFLFCECLKLDQNSCNQVAMDFLCKLIGATVIRKLKYQQEELRNFSRKACYPGNKIPKWMRHQSEGLSTITIKLQPNRHSSNFFGFVMCVVVSFEELYCCKNLGYNCVDIRCELHMKTKYGQSYNCGSSEWELVKEDFGPEDGKKREILKSDHVFMWHHMYHGYDYVDAVEMSFVFSCESYDYKNREYCYLRYQVKRCGAHMLYIEEEAINEFDMSIQQYVECMVEAEERGISILQCMKNSEELEPRLGDSIRGGPAFGGELHPRPSDKTSPVNLSFSQSTPQLAPVSQQISPLHMPIKSPHQLPLFLQRHPQTLASYLQSHPPLSSLQQLSQLLYSSSQPAIGQPLPSQQLVCSNRQLPISQPQVRHSLSSATPHQSPLNINLQPLPTAPIQQQFHPQQSPSQLSQMLSQQKQALQASFQSSRQAFSQLQQQLGLVQPSSSQDTKQQQQQAGTAAQAITSLPTTIASADVSSSSTSVAPAVPVKCPWTEHFFPDGYESYYNNATSEGKREKPEELILYEQQQQQQQQKATVLQNQFQSLHQCPTAQQVSQTPQIEFQTRFQMQAQQQFQRAPLSSTGYAQLQGVTSSRQQAFQLWMWKNNQADAPDQVNNLTRLEIAPKFYDFFGMEVPLDDDKNSADPQWDSTATHVEGLCLNLSLALFPSGDQTNNILNEDDLNTIINEPELSNTQVINFDTEESCIERVKCFDFCRCSNFLCKILEWFQANSGN